MSEGICRLCGGRPNAIVSASWTFRIERDAPNQNDRVVNAGATRWKYSAERNAWRNLLAALPRDRALFAPGTRRRVTVTRCYSGQQKLRDQGNLVGGLKPVIDAMKLAGLIVDDAPEWVEVYCHQRRVEKSERGTLITIEELA